ncbi:MAG: hypothetical protein K2K28_00845, partial [Clostridia bacterium]|nr:hypothetical protein [Clostridia bacterium]
KMKAEAAAAAGIGAAGVAMAAQPQQQMPVQQVQQQPAADSNALAKLEAEIAMLRAENKAMHQQNTAMPMAQPMMMPMQQPMMQMPMQVPMQSYGPMPQYGNNNVGDVGALARLEAQLTAMQAQQRAKDEAEHRAEMSAMRAEMKATKEAEQTAELAAIRTQMQHGVNAANVPAVQQVPVQGNANNSTNAMEMLGALVVAALKNIAEPKASENKPVEQRVVEAEPPTAVSAPTVYPPDAVVTTTTRVDTTKPQPKSINRDDGRLFDIDGFYDTFDGTK